MLNYARHERIFLQSQSAFGENWLHERICEDPSILGLGKLEVLDRERVQDRAGRLDVLLANPVKNRRYEVEIMFGAADPSHIMRCIEYWDIERRRYPAYEHVAVLIAEDITGRYLNILGLFAGSIPLIVIQLNALKVGEQIVLDFVQVLNQTSLRRDDETRTSTRGSSREEWVKYAGEKSIGLVEAMLGMINEKAQIKQQLNYLQQYIGLTDGVRSRNFVSFDPKKKFIYLYVNVTVPEDFPKRLEEAGLPASMDDSELTVTIEPDEFGKHGEVLRQLLHAAVEAYQSS